MDWFDNNPFYFDQDPLRDLEEEFKYKGEYSMDNLALNILDSVVEQNESFRIDTPEKAEWALCKIKEEKKGKEELIAVCNSFIEKYQAKIQEYEKQFESSTSYLRQQLQEFFNIAPYKETKTQATYKLPSGTLKLKYPAIEYKRDEKKLGEFLKSNNYQGYYEEIVKPKWAELKKICKVAGQYVVDVDSGNIIEGVEAVEKPASFEIEV